ncbi:hypothetical protein Q1695_013562 [Nippostrongylus brasiliensis]|nr:hypothetical protein Q1695_013562 [Nippostrongylus brasiliensis]
MCIPRTERTLSTRKYVLNQVPLFAELMLAKQHSDDGCARFRWQTTCPGVKRERLTLLASAGHEHRSSDPFGMSSLPEDECDLIDDCNCWKAAASEEECPASFFVCDSPTRSCDQIQGTDS